MKIKVLNIITGGLSSDGISNAWLTYCKEFIRQNRNKIIRMDFASIQNAKDISIEREFNQIGIQTIKLPSRLKNPIKYIWDLYKILKKGHYTVIHANGSSNLLALEMFAAVLAGVPVRVAHSRNTTTNYILSHKILTYPFKWMCNTRIACGEDAGKWLFHNDKFEILHNGKNLEKFKFSKEIREKSRESLGLKDEFVIGHVGRFNEQKNHIFIIETFYQFLKLYPNSKLLLIGHGSKFNEIKSMVEKYDMTSNVIFTGSVSDVSYKLHSADLMLLPSLYEGLPNVVLEWQALGLPSIISNSITKECAVSNLIYFLDLKDGTEFWAKRIFDLAFEKRNRLTDSNEACIALKKHGFDISDTVKNLINIYHNSLK